MAKADFGGKVIFSGRAKVSYYNRYCVAYIDKEIVKYYRSLIPKYFYVSPQMYDPHITIIRLDKENPLVYNWGYRDGEYIDFEYENFIYNDSLYWWLNVYSIEICNIRMLMGLPPYREPFHSHHITLGNTK